MVHGLCTDDRHVQQAVLTLLEVFSLHLSWWLLGADHFESACCCAYQYKHSFIVGMSHVLPGLWVRLRSLGLNFHP